MKIFVVGMPQSGRTTVSKAISQANDYNYVDAYSWVKSMFREMKPGEKKEQYEDEFHTWFVNRLKIQPNMIVENVYNSMSAYGPIDDKKTYVIDGIFSPRDLIQLFDYNKDVFVLLNRLGNPADYKDYENIGVSHMKDYCFWLASAELLPRDRWFEYNFSMPGEENEFVKELGQKNSVFIVRSINRAIAHLRAKLKGEL